MEYMPLGSTSLQVSRIGYGCAAMGGYDYGPVNDHDSVGAIQRALELGVNFFDTADVYGFGHAEEVLGRALGSRKQEVVVATKFGVRWDAQGRTMRDISPGWAEQAAEGSLRRLGLDCIPLYQIHWPHRPKRIQETLEALVRLQHAGKIRYIGCCNFPPDTMDEAQAYCRLESLQMPYSISERQFEKTISSYQKHTVAILSYNSLGQGSLTGKYGRDSRFEGTDLRRRSKLFQGEKLERNLILLERLKVVGARYNRTPAQVAIRWILDNPTITCAIVGIKTSKQIEENAGALGWRLSGEDRELLTKA